MNAPVTHNTIDELVLHRAPMLLIDSVIGSGDTFAHILVNPQTSMLFVDATGQVPAWVGIEYMAQAISAFAGIDAKKRGNPLCLGFLLGTRKYKSQVTHFSLHQPLRVSVHELMRDETNLVLFDCHIYAGDALLASAEIKAIQPKANDPILAQLMPAARE